VRIGREAAHVRADLGQSISGRACRRRDAVEQFDFTAERARQLLDALRQRRDRLVEEVDLASICPISSA
jgi:hypothetical protein